MCGIAGVYRFSGRPVEAPVLDSMTQSLRHRGPDASGTVGFSLNSGRFSRDLTAAPLEGGLGVTRLRIRELSPQADQPFAAPTAPIFLAFNGELYNAGQHRRRLQAKGVQLRGSSDTEVLLALVQESGLPAALEQVEGMFAVALVDLTCRQIWLARDRFGIKPLYWHECANGDLLFASEVKSFLAYPDFRVELDPDRLSEALMFRFCAGPQGLIKGVRELQPGTLMRVAPDGFTFSHYWRLPRRSARRRTGLRVAAQELGEQLEQAVTRHLASDVPIGCQLSGGVDSSLITWFAQKQSAQLAVHSVIPHDPGYSERPWIDEVLTRTGLEGRFYTLDCDSVVSNWERAAWHLDQPATHPNSLGLLLMAERARARSPVLLAGEGADELLGGYTRMLYSRLLPWIRAGLPWVGWIPGWGEQIATRFEKSRSDPAGWYVLEAAFMTPPQLQRLLPESDLEAALGGRRELFSQQPGDFFEQCLRYEMATYLPDLLMRQDRMGMAHSVEIRVPFLDDRLAAHSLGLPSQYLAGGNFYRGRSNAKLLLKHLASTIFGNDLAYRPKQGFSLPVAAYLRDAGFRRLVEGSLLPSLKRRGLLHSASLQDWWRQLQAGNNDLAEPLWISLAFEQWAILFLDGQWRNHVTTPAEPRSEIQETRAF